MSPARMDTRETYRFEDPAGGSSATHAPSMHQIASAGSGEPGRGLHRDWRRPIVG